MKTDIAKKHLTRVADFYHTAFAEDPPGRDFLSQKGITDNILYSGYRLGLANGTLINTLPGQGKIRDQLTALGVLTPDGKETLANCLTFPIYDKDGNACGIVGHFLNGKNKGKETCLPDPCPGVFNWQTAKTFTEIILVPSFMAALVLINAGIKNAIPLYGQEGLTADHLDLFEEYRTGILHLCFNASDSIIQKIEGQGINTNIITLPDNLDICEFFSSTADAVRQFAEMLHPRSRKKPAAKKKTPASKKSDDNTSITPTDFGFTVKIDCRTYEIRGLQKRNNKLKAIVKAIAPKKRMHIDSVDFYSARSRSYYIKCVCDLFEKDEPTISNDIDYLLTIIESDAHESTNSSSSGLTDKEKNEALSLLNNPNMFDEILADIETIGYTGEETNKLLCYIAAISRKMDSPLSVMIQSRSAAGKSYLQDTILSLFPEKDVIKYTRLTNQALFYADSKGLKHKILAIEELDGMNGAIYSIRSIQSSKEITIAYSAKDTATGKQTIQKNIVQGPLMVFITTTQINIDGETASRFVFISVDESEEMTKKILDKQRQSHTLEGLKNKINAEQVRTKHKNASRLLKPLHVFNPYAEYLTFTTKSLRARRDHVKYLNLISAIAYLFQYQKEQRQLEYNGQTIDYINVSLEDIEKANRIANFVLGRTLDELSPPSQELLSIIQQMVKERSSANNIEAYHFNRRQIREYSGWGDFQIRTHIKQLEDLEYIYSASGKRGKEYVYELLYTDTGNNSVSIGLIDIEELKEKTAQLHI